ncbi:hypothetical protein [Thalassospira sp. CH_XMU1448-2]|uniref:hypothetical protein n=1 Tax=Thalassospira sp. CH_XMU1448-2 TaxID=3107773 RepID=UPI00300A4F13
MANNLQLLPPGDWEAFESICLDVWRERWRDDFAQKNGRKGQSQNGIDIISSGNRSGFYGVQCKGKDNFLQKTLTLKEVESELKKARDLIGNLREFTVATTAPRDAVLQRQVLELSTLSQCNGGPKVYVWFWDDIRDIILGNEDILYKHYPQHCPPNIRSKVRTIEDGSFEFDLYPNGYQADLKEVFCTPEVLSVVSGLMRTDLGALSHEIVRNAFEHGRATKATIQVSASSFAISDNGREFNSLDGEFLSKSDGVGLKLLHRIKEKFSSVLNLSYKYDGKNNILLSFSLDISEIDFDSRCEIRAPSDIVDRYFLRDNLVIPDGCDVYHFVLPSGYYGFSDIVKAIRNLLEKISSTSLLIIYVSEASSGGEVMEDCFDDPRLRFVLQKDMLFK